MEFNEALFILGIEKYSERIFNSNSRGELIHLYQYCVLAEEIGETEYFIVWFEEIIEIAEKEWERPESVFQHILEIFLNQLKNTSFN